MSRELHIEEIIKIKIEDIERDYTGRAKIDKLSKLFKTPQMKEKHTTYGWIFIEQLDGNWAAARREDYYELFNGDKGNVFRAPDIDSLRSLINAGEGDVGKMLKLIK